MKRGFLRVAAIIFVLTLLSEIFVRTFLILPAASTSDEELGWVYKPYATILHTSEGRALNKLNSLGFNDDDPDMNPGKIHILVLGDSLTEALQVPRSENFTSIAEEMQPCLDFYNAGRSGLSPVHYPTVMSRVTRLLAPALTVVVVSAGDLSDIRDGKYEIIRDDSDNRITGLHLHEEPLDKLRVMLDPILGRSALATYLMQRVKALLINKNRKNKAKDKAVTVITDADKQLIKEILVYLLASMNSKTPVAILYLPKMLYGVNRTAVEDQQSDEFERLLADAASIVGVPLLSTETRMKSSYHEYGQPGVGFPNNNILSGHLNRLGHQAVALALLDLVSEAGVQCQQILNIQNN